MSPITSEFRVDTVPPMSDSEYNYFTRLVYEEVGINLGPDKREMLMLRLNKRLKALGLRDYKSYISFLRGKTGAQELIFLIDVVSTNKTDFFRESIHFDFVSNHIVPSLVEQDSESKIKVWSAGCSSGEEPYTIAMVLEECLADKFGWNYSILATDVSTRMLEAASKAIYPDRAAQPIPSNYRKKYVMNGKGSFDGFIRILPRLRGKVEFRRLNFRENIWTVEEKFNIIFCRNVIIYFDLEMQKRMFAKFYDSLVPGGYMIIGSSETLKYISEKFVVVGPTVYQKSY